MHSAWRLKLGHMEYSRLMYINGRNVKTTPLKTFEENDIARKNEVGFKGNSMAVSISLPPN
jgi:hypothetical protein